MAPFQLKFPRIALRWISFIIYRIEQKIAGGDSSVVVDSDRLCIQSQVPAVHIYNPANIDLISIRSTTLYGQRRQPYGELGELDCYGVITTGSVYRHARFVCERDIFKSNTLYFNSLETILNATINDIDSIIGARCGGWESGRSGYRGINDRLDICIDYMSSIKVNRPRARIRRSIIYANKITALELHTVKIIATIKSNYCISRIIIQDKINRQHIVPSTAFDIDFAMTSMHGDFIIALFSINLNLTRPNNGYINFIVQVSSNYRDLR